MLVQSADGKRSATGGTRSLVRVSGSTNMCPHAGSADEVAYMKFDEVMVFTVEKKARENKRDEPRLTAIDHGVTR